ncbi:endonuclease/exonuclease/phosphatase family protein [candidate division KSB1 bacterium]|nr:endonuclease/exonuclease/phosphatase family protein [candidate division KSB1 bacterium]
MLRVLKWVFVVILFISLSMVIFFWITTFHPPEVKHIEIFCDKEAPSLKAGQSLKIVTYNIQFLAGKNYLFYYEMPNYAGPDERPSSEDIGITLNELVRVIKDENPDILLLQEVDDGAKRTDYKDQLKLILSKLPPEYCCYTSAFYWKAKFVPHKRIMGAVGMKLSVISKYKIDSATRHQLAPVPGNPIVNLFKLRRAILETRLPVEGNNYLSIFNVHLEAFPETSNVMEKQTKHLDSLLTIKNMNTSWVAGGDFNLTPPKNLDADLDTDKKSNKNENLMNIFYDKYQVIPKLSDVNSAHSKDWFTYFPNNPKINAPTKTIDYIIFSDQIQLVDYYVRQHDTLKISDHLPVCAIIEIR